MNRPVVDDSWPDCWKSSYSYDRLEIYGENPGSGYAQAYRQRRDVTLDLVTSALSPGSRVLDVAAAQGNFSLTLAERGYDVTWNDLRGDLAGYVRMKHESGTIRYAPGNLFDLDFDQPFDGALITEVIEHVAHPDRFLTHVARLVRPDGVVVMTTPNGAYFRNKLPRFSDCPNPAAYEAVQFRPNADGHIFLLQPDEVPWLARRAGLSVDCQIFFTNPVTHGQLMSGPLLRLLPAGVVDRLERASRYLPVRMQHACLIQMAARFRKLQSTPA
jgi:2-polyprenyl-6-hydroxyphenyl methylase/3-demethylubiquinone-9 3-methyltransferase